MAKPLPLIIGGVGLTGAAAGGVYMVRSGGSGGANPKATTANSGTNNPSPEQPATTTPKQEKFFDTVAAFKGTAKENSCVSSQFGESFTINDTNASEINGTTPATGSFFKQGSEAHTSCLVIQWKKNTGSDGKWNGKFTWVGTFVKGSEGFITFNVAEPSNEDKKLKFTGVFYLLNKESNTGRIKHKKVVEGEGKKVDANALEASFPRAKDPLKATKKEYWGFMENKSALDNVCNTGTTNTCTPIVLDQAKVTKLKWTANSSEPTKTIWDWSSSSEWWNKMYGVTEWKLKDKLTEIKGTGTEVTGAPQ